jgi:tRNA uridine 5-carboxymethylaminomethyl modification enzyme
VDEIYVNGYSMSLPARIQERLVRALPGLEEAVMTRPGYAVEYDFVQPTELDSTLQTEKVRGLYFAGQINGTSGYEEAAAQGLVAGANAGLASSGEAPLVLTRDSSYIGTLVDDLVTKGCLEPYRMFTSRAEHRLLLRIDNADLRLTPIGRQAGLVGDERWRTFEARRQRFDNNCERVRGGLVTVGTGVRVPAARALKQPEVRLRQLLEAGEIRMEVCPTAEAIDLASVETEFKYEGYLKRQMAAVERQRRQECRAIPEGFGFAGIPGLSREVIERLSSVRPATLGQASRIPGVTPAAIAVIAAYLNKPHGRVPV